MGFSIRKINKRNDWINDLGDMTQEQLENDEISAAEAGFMEGYLRELEIIEEEE